MNQKRKKEILKTLNEAIEKTKITAQKRRETAKYFRRASRSQQGDRRYFENIADLAESALGELLAFKKEFLSASEKTGQTVKPISFIEIKYQNGEISSFYFVKNSIRLPNLELITSSSPLGKSIDGKKPGEKFSYQIKREGQTTTYSGKIKKIE